MSLLWSGNFIIGKIAMRDMGSFALVWIRAFLSCLILVPMLVITTPAGEWSRIRNGWKILFVVGMLGVTLNQGFYFYGLRITSVAHAAVIGSTSPLIIFIISYFTGHEILNFRRVTGLALAVTGVGLLTNLRPSSVAGHGPSLKGDLFAIASSLAFSGAGVLGRKVTEHFSSITINATGYFLALFMMFPVAANELRAVVNTGISTAGWLTLLYLSAGSSVLAYLIFYWAIHRVGATRASVFTYLQPVFVTLMGLAFLHEHVSWPEIACTGVILAGVFLTERG